MRENEVVDWREASEWVSSFLHCHSLSNPRSLFPFSLPHTSLPTPDIEMRERVGDVAEEGILVSFLTPFVTRREGQEITRSN